MICINNIIIIGNYLNLLLKCYHVNYNFSHLPPISWHFLKIFNRLYPIFWACILKPKKTSSGTVIMTDYLKSTWQPSQPILLLYPDAFPSENKRDYWHPRSMPGGSYCNIAEWNFSNLQYMLTFFYFGKMWTD